MKTIRISKNITINNLTTLTELLNVYNDLLSELKQKYPPSNAQGRNWDYHLKNNRKTCVSISNSLNSYAESLLKIHNVSDVTISAKPNYKEFLVFYKISIEEYDFVNAEINLHFQSRQFELLEILEQSVLVKGSEPENFPLIFDLNNADISISEYLI